MAARKKIQNISKNVAADAALLVPSASLLQQFESGFDPEMSAGAEGASGLAPFISTEDGVFHLGTNVIGKRIDAVILGVAVEHALYPGRYQKGKPNNPVCFYIGQREGEAVPHESSPQKQATACATCVKNAFGSGQGNAKACRQSRRLLVLPLGEDEDPASANVYRLRVPPTSIKYIVGYNNLLKSYKRPIQSLVTNIHLESHEQNRFEVRFDPLRPINDPKVLDAIARRATEGKDALFALPMVAAERGGSPGVKGGRRVVRR